MTDSIDVYIDQDPTQSQVDPQATTKERIPDPSTTRLCVDVVRKPLRTNYIYGMQVRRCDTMVGRCLPDSTHNGAHHAGPTYSGGTATTSG